MSLFFVDGEVNVLDDILTEAPDQDDELYNPESEQDVNEKKGIYTNSLFCLPILQYSCMPRW